MGIRRMGRQRQQSAVSRKRSRSGHQQDRDYCKCDYGSSPTHASWHGIGVEGTTRLELPDYVTRPFEVYVNGVLQTEGPDYSVDAERSLVFPRELASEGSLSKLRWLSIFLGVAGTYRKNESVDVACTVNGKPVVASLTSKASHAAFPQQG